MTSNEQQRWYAVRVKSNRERITSEALKGKDFEVFLPLMSRERDHGSSPSNSAVVPLFAGYLFCRFDARNRLPILTVPGVVHIVGFGNVPEPVNADEMARIFALAESRLRMIPHPFTPVGQRVRIEAGPLRGIEGLVLTQQGKDKLVVSITVLQRSIAVNLEREWIAPVSN